MNKNMHKHVRIVTVLFIILGAIYLLAFVFIAILGLMATYNRAQTGEVSLLPAMITGGLIILPLALLGVLHIITARAFRIGKAWSRIAMWILAILNLGNVPLGTGLGIYAVWVLIQTREEMQKISK